MDDRTRSQLRKMVQEARALLLQEARQQLEGIYGIHSDGRRESVDNLPEARKDPEKQQTLLDILHFLDMEQQAGLQPAEAVERLANEVAFTHLNRFVAFKMMEARRLIKQTVSRGSQSNAFLLYVVEVLGKASMAEVEDVDRAYRDFILHQCRQIATDLQVLFEPDNLASKLFPRPRALKELLALINHEELASVWQEDETIGWVYQYFIEEEKDRVFEKIYRHKQKMDLRDIPKATQIFTPRWIVQYLVENTLGRLWLRMHPDSRLREEMKYYVPNPYTDNQPLPVKSVRQITLLDPACGTMHFGLVAFDLFYEMYLEELENAGKPGWPELTAEVAENAEHHEDENKNLSAPFAVSALSAVNKEDIPVAIVENNLYGIDIDLRAIQLAALTLYLKVKSRNKDAHIGRLNLTYTDIPPIPEGDMDGFVQELNLSHSIARELLREILPELNKAYYLGSLLKIEETVQRFIHQKRRELEKQPLAAMAEHGEAVHHNPGHFWEAIKADIRQGLQAAVTRQTNGHSLVAGEAITGLGLIDALMKKYDVVVANPPFSGRRNWTTHYAAELKSLYSQNALDMYAAFMDRNIGLLNEFGFLGMINIHTFMFTSSYVQLRKQLIENTRIETMNHVGPIFMDLSNPYAQQATCYVLQNNKPDKDSKAVYFRMVMFVNQEKIARFEKALADWQAYGEQATDRHIFVVRQEDFKAIPGWPLVYWVSEGVRRLFLNSSIIGDYRKKKGIAEPRLGMATGDNTRFLRFWWEVSKVRVNWETKDLQETYHLNGKWYPYMKGGNYNKWFGNQEAVINWKKDGQECKNNKKGDRVVSHNYNADYSFKEGATYSFLTVSNLSVRYLPPGFIFDVIGSSIFPKNGNPKLLIALLNSKISTYLIKILNPTVAFQVGDIARLPYPDVSKYPELVQAIEHKAQTCIHLKRSLVKQEPTSWEYVVPPDWKAGMQERLWKEYRLTVLESEISEMVYWLYEVGEEDIQQIEAEFGPLPTRGSKVNPDDAEAWQEAVQRVQIYFLQKHIPEEALKSEEELAAEAEEGGNSGRSRQQARYLTFEEVCVASRYHPDTVYEVFSQAGWERPEERWELAFNWLEYAISILMGRFKPGETGALGSGIIHKNDFITGSLTISEEEFEQITRYFPTAYKDASGKHRFPKEIEDRLRQTPDPDSIMVLDKGHPDDLPARVEEVLTLLLGEATAGQVMAALIGEATPDRRKSRKFLERDFFGKHHLKMYRKRPIYWLLQTANKNYGFYLFHERLDKDTLYKLQRNYIDPKLRLIGSHLAELKAKYQNALGREKRALEVEIDKLESLHLEIAEFQKAVQRVTARGYDPDINDGVILNMAPLHELIPWKEPAQYWKELEQGRYDWAHIAMKYWPERVKAKCRKDKSLAIAHGLEA